MKIAVELHEKKKAMVAAMQNDRLPYWRLWRELADYYLPSRYTYLMSDKERAVRNARNPHILDGTGTRAARVLAAGMMNGITSPSRPWFRLRLPNFDDASNKEARMWLDEVARRMLLVMAESNFYNGLAVMYLDLVIFGTSAMLIYEDYESVIRCYNPNLGEFYICNSERLAVNTFARSFRMSAAQMEARWGKEALSQQVQSALQQGGAQRQAEFEICHLIEPNDTGDKLVPKRFKYRELYWEAAAPAGQVLSVAGYNELPGIFPRYELSGNDAYGTCPAMDALGDVIQLQHETKRKAQGLDKMVSPPIIADIQLQHRPSALLPNGITYLSGVNNVGVKPAYTVNIPIDALTMDIRDLSSRIRETFHNDLFLMISQLDTVRTAAEIYERKEEKLVMLGSVLERFENEALDPAVNRIFSIMDRAGLLPPVPNGLEGADIEIQYESILSTAQRAVTTAPTERWLQLVAQLSPVYPKAVNIPNFDELLRGYGADIGVPARYIRTQEEVAQLNAQADQLAQAREAAATGGAFVDSAQTLSQTDVGGGANALQQLLGA